MNPLVASPSGRRKHPDDSWRIGRLLASLSIFLVSIFAAWSLYRSEFVSLFTKNEMLQSFTITSLNLSGDYLCVSAISAAFLSAGIIFCAFLKSTLVTSSKPAPGRITSQSLGSEDNVEGTKIDTSSGSGDDSEDMWCHDEDSFDMTLDTYTQLYDVLNTGNDKPKACSPIYEDTNESREVRQTVRANGCPVSELNTCRHFEDDSHGLIDKKRQNTQAPVYSADHDMETSRLHDQVKGQTSRMNNLATQTDAISNPTLVSSGTMTSNPHLVDASVGSQKVFKIVRSCDTLTSGPFMKKLRRAQRLLNEARVKFKSERQSKLLEWKLILSRYKDRVKTLLQSLEKKDILMSYTALNRALSENEVKDMSTTVSSARDRLLTQCKLNFALKEVVESKCDSGTSDLQGQSSGAQV